MHSKYGTPQEDIALCIINPDTGKPITRVTLNNHFGLELKRGLIDANLATSRTLYDIANGFIDKEDIYHAPSQAACMFWLKTRAGWRETQHTVNENINRDAPITQDIIDKLDKKFNLEY